MGKSWSSVVRICFPSYSFITTLQINSTRNKFHSPRGELSGSVKLSDSARVIQLVSGKTRLQQASAESEWFPFHLAHIRGLILWWKSITFPHCDLAQTNHNFQVKSYSQVLLFTWQIENLFGLVLVSYYGPVDFYFMDWEGQTYTWSGSGSGRKSTWLWRASVVCVPRRLEQREFPQRAQRIDVFHR